MILKEFLEDVSPKNSLLKTMYRTIYEHGPISRADILEKVKAKQTTVARFIEELLENGFIQERGLGKSSGGRPPVLYHIDTTKGYIIGVDLSRSHTKILLFDLAFNQIDASSVIMTFAHTPEQVFSYIIEVIARFMTKHGFTVDELLGIGVGSVGPLNREKGIILQPEAFLAPGWKNIDVAALLCKAYPVRIMLENGANTAALGEYTYAKVPYKNVLYCISGAGLRCGMIANGQIMHMRSGDANAYGHTVIQVDGLRCSCGNQGCLAAYVSFGYIIEEVKRKAGFSASSLLQDGQNKDSLSIYQIIRAANEGDHVANEVLMKSAYYYGVGIANLVNSLHPELVIVNSAIVYEVPSYYAKIVETASQYIYGTEREDTKFSPGLLQSNAAATGAAIMIFQSFLQ
ncbi:hypothetical protein AM501_20075 [Aneurinibacillus migulanus]|uniref:ROK family transcriptional regulator n=1 Tax=Aneurinibacillus migulanus TaxID=47500 RepID=UPI0005BDF4F3|nr:ROK family transcriptional regulator [Aneurinibacillus migulanus]KIV55992.1 hypothetical protein TS64_10855 [Aneurinibacillus migulanus]KPD06511.1 hypothetical protein AM501_20075 [Aneurinibacillus migulanus]